MNNEKFSLISLLVILALILPMLTVVIAPDPAAASTGCTIVFPKTDNVTYVRTGQTVPVRYTLAAGGSDPNAMQLRIYSTGAPVGSADTSRSPGASYTENVLINPGTAEGLYNLSVSDGETATQYALNSVRVDNTAPTGSVLIPSSTTVWKGGSTQSIYFTTQDTASLTENVTVVLESSTNGGGAWSTVTVPAIYPGGSMPQGQQSWTWTVTATDSVQCLIRMTVTDKAGNPSGYITSSTFTILNTAPTVTVTYPSDTGLSWTAGARCNISWSIAGSVATTLNYILSYDIASGGGGYPYTIATLNSRSRVSTDNYSFTAPYVPYAARNLVRVKVTATDSAGNTGNDASNNDFTINDTTIPVVTLTSPTGGENWLAGSSHDITWTQSDL
ncbi:MAG: hypothetical protein PHG36_12005, partial [Dehalococcoidia bacterium]|nr:hypothetical protein [Dehalococcoidia bacterium]